MVDRAGFEPAASSICYVHSSFRRVSRLSYSSLKLVLATDWFSEVKQ